MTDTITYVESETSQEQHKHMGWFWDVETKKYYRWNDLMSLYGRDYFDTELSSMKEQEIK